MIRPFLRLIRLYYSLPLSIGLLVIVSYVTAGRLSGLAPTLALAIASLTCLLSAGYALNDFCDIASDRVNAPYRPIAAALIKPRTALAASIAFFAAAIILAAFAASAFALAIILISIALISYDLFSKRLGLLKPLFVALLVTALYPLAFTLADPVPSPRLCVLYIHPAWLFLSALAYQMLKDVRDLKGDTPLHLSSHKAYASAKWFLPAARTLMFIAAAITLLPNILGLCGPVYLASAILACILAAISVFKTPRPAIRLIYAHVFLITAGSLLDLLIFGP
jgi:geranylgeranylglycerol-phosphate geranylgeranyltransferase